MSFDLSQLGWKAFQDLTAAVAAEVLKRPVQTFLGSNDGGRDGSFLGRWDAAGPFAGKSTIQCKFLGKPGATLTLADLKDELPKALKLAADGLADDYIIITNAGVSGDSDRQICRAFEAVGVKQCRTFDGGWIVKQLTENSRLRMLVPRVYGIGDLSHIITGHGYRQAKAILDSMGSDLSCFVPTEAYSSAVEALQQHGFVILLGDPASGKSTIAAILALGALDEGCLGALKINSPDQLSLWHPGEKQFLWVDDAFGPNNFDAARMSGWNAQLSALRAAVEGGARVVFTSRNYIWEAARPHLKTSAFPLFKESQVVVNVHALSEAERGQMLYNHVRRIQPQIMRQRLKPYLPAVAANQAFLPETARRLGDPLFTKNLVISEGRLIELVEHPVEFLTEVLEQLDDASRAAVALIFLNSQSGVPSPITETPALGMVMRLMGVSHAEIARAMQHLNDSVTRLASELDGDRWVFRHPTVTDAFATLVARSPELIEMYVHGARLDRLMGEAACHPKAAEGGRIRIPPAVYSTLVERLKHHPLDDTMMWFLGTQCERTFLEQVLVIRTDILKWAEGAAAKELVLGGRVLFAAMASWSLFPEVVRKAMIAKIREDSITWLNAKPLTNDVTRKIFKGDEFAQYEAAFRKEWLSNIPDIFSELGRYSSEDEAGLYNEFKENLQVAQKYFKMEDNEEFDELYEEIDAHIESLGGDDRSYGGGWNSASMKPEVSGSNSGAAADIFQDVDA